MPEEHFTQETRFRHRLRLDPYSHYPKHVKAIREWREQSVEEEKSRIDTEAAAMDLTREQ